VRRTERRMKAISFPPVDSGKGECLLMDATKVLFLRRGGEKTFYREWCILVKREYMREMKKNGIDMRGVEYMLQYLERLTLS
jgi:hypothetical protein